MFNFLNISGKGAENILIVGVLGLIGFFLYRYLMNATPATSSATSTNPNDYLSQLGELALLEASGTGAASGTGQTATTIQPVAAVATGSNAGGTASASASTSSTGQGGGGGTT